nr:hypothetical protein [Tanacetum cinerariifolium]
VEHEDAKKCNEIYYPMFTKVIVHYFMSNDPLIPRRNRVNWHYVKDDPLFTTIKLVFRHQNTQQFSAMLPIELTNAYIRNSKSYKEYYAVSTGDTPPKTKASVWKTKSSSDTTITPPPTAAVGIRLSTFTKGKQLAKSSKTKSLTILSEETNDDDQDSKKEGEEFIHPKLNIHDEEETKDEESFDPIPKTPEHTYNEGNDQENRGLNVGMEERQDEEDDEDELYRDVNINLEGRVIQMADVHTTQEFEDSHVTLTPVNPDGQQQSSSVSSQFVTSMLNPTPDARIDSIFETTSQMDVQALTTVAPLPLSAPTLTPSTIATISTVPQAPTPSITASSTLLQDLPNFGLLRDEAQAENKEFLKNHDENIQKIIKEQVKEQVKVQVSKILPKIEQTVNKQLEAEVLTRSSNSSKTSYAVTADLSKLELKKILIEKIEDNKSIHRSNEQRNIYKALIKAYESDKIILDTYRDIVTLKRRRDDDADKDEEPSAGSDRGSKRQRKGKEPDESVTVEEPMQTTHEMEEPSHPEFKTGDDDQPIAKSSQHPEWFSQQNKSLTPDRKWTKTLPATNGSIQTWISELAKQTDSRLSFNELMDTPVDFSAFPMNRLKVDTLTPELLARPTYELIKGSCKSLVELEVFLEVVYKAMTDQLDWINTEGHQYPHNLLMPLLLIPNSRGLRVIPFDHFINNDLEYLCGGASSHKESARDVYSKRRIITITVLKIVEWHNYKHLDWIIVRKDDDKLYKFKEGDFKRLRIQDIEDMLQLLKKLNLTRPDTYRSDLMRKEAYTAYSNPRGFIYQNKHKQNRLMWIDELHKFNYGTLIDVRTALDDRLKGIQMKYLP